MTSEKMVKLSNFMYDHFFSTQQKKWSPSMGVFYSLRNKLGINKTAMARIIKMDYSNAVKVDNNTRSLSPTQAVAVAQLAVYAQQAQPQPVTADELKESQYWLHSQQDQYSARVRRLDRELEALQKSFDAFTKHLPALTSDAPPALHRLKAHMDEMLTERKRRKIYLEMVKKKIIMSGMEAQLQKIAELLSESVDV